jgi:transcriptional repressor NrdR
MEHRQLWILKRNGSKQPFSSQKVLAGIVLACRKRPFEPDELDRLVDRVVHRLEERRDACVSAVDVGAVVMGVLREVDDVAYIRFASVYGAFESVEQFLDVIVPLRASA